MAPDPEPSEPQAGAPGDVRSDRFIDSGPGLTVIDRSGEEGPPLFGEAERAALGVGRRRRDGTGRRRR